jgi:hypothetical protein
LSATDAPTSRIGSVVQEPSSSQLDSESAASHR